MAFNMSKGDSDIFDDGFLSHYEKNPRNLEIGGLSKDPWTLTPGES